MDNIDNGDSDSGNEINEVRHSNLLEAVSHLDVKQRVKPPSRKESSFQVSEFHLAKSDANKNTIHVDKLTKLLGQQGSHATITKQLNSVHQKSKTLPRPLEKPIAERIQRSVGFKNVRTSLGRWDAVVHSNRASDQLTFPLKQGTIEFESTNDFVSKIMSQSRTPLEAQMDELLNKSPAVQQERKEQQEYQLTLAEMRERRKEMAKLRAQQSYMASKAHRQNKIKSKKFHRIQRRDHIRQQLKEFELLQKSDPEAALQQLEQLERTRAQERVSLRHRSTGQWAKNKAVRAKYDKESRQALAEQLAVSREMTQKIQTEDSSDEEEGTEKVLPTTDSENPWIATKTSSEVEEFVSGYRKFWDERNKKLAEDTANTVVRQRNEESGAVEIEEHKTSAVDVKVGSIVQDMKLSKKNDVGSGNNKIFMNENDKFVSELDTEENISDLVHGSHSGVSNRKRKRGKKNNTKDIELINVCENELSGKESQNRKSDKESINKNLVNSHGFIVSDITKMPESTTVRKVKNNSETSSMIGSDSPVSKKRKKKLQNKKYDIAETQKILRDMLSDTAEINVMSHNETIETTSGNWTVTPEKKQQYCKKKIGELLDDMEDKLRRKFKETLKKVRSQLNIKDTNDEDNVTSGSDDDDGPSLEMKRAVVRPDIDEELDEQLNTRVQEDGVTFTDLRNVIEQSTVKDKEVSEDNIDPNKFIAMKPKHLLTELPDVMTAGDEAIDESEQEDERQMTITEAFAEDDVIAEFRKEKEDEIEKSNPKEVDLSLPGWGEWGGKNLAVSKRKKQRFVFKFPEVAPRKDANKGSLIINEEKNDKVKTHQVSELPFPFSSVKDFEASIRAPIGRTWVPETAYRKLTRPSVVTKLGTVIEPMDEDILVNKKNKLKGFM